MQCFIKIVKTFPYDFKIQLKSLRKIFSLVMRVWEKGVGERRALVSVDLNKFERLKMFLM